MHATTFVVLALACASAAAQEKWCSTDVDCQADGDADASCGAATFRCYCSAGYEHPKAELQGHCVGAGSRPRTVDLLFKVQYDNVYCEVEKERQHLIAALVGDAFGEVLSFSEYCTRDSGAEFAGVVRVETYVAAKLAQPANPAATSAATLAHLAKVDADSAKEHNGVSRYENVRSAPTAAFLGFAHQCVAPNANASFVDKTGRCQAVDCGRGHVLSFGEWSYAEERQGLSTCVSRPQAPSVVVEESDDDLTRGEVAGIVVGSVSLFVVAVIAGILLVAKKEDTPEDEETKELDEKEEA
eukprot:Rhum_TRINITY_DN13497_c1_g1::Rhum_TRINITY_DN13497_c1_g1_i1::g.59789::m.59789